MAVDKNLFPYDLAVVAILWNEGRYLKEWLDYHLAAGVDHFYLYDHESTDNYNEIIKPYVEKGIVTSVYYPGKKMQCAAYDDAVSKYKFFCRYMAFIDGDEFIFPQSDKSIVEVVDEIFSLNSNAGGIAINWQNYGSNFQEKADYSKGVLERFPRRAQKDYSPIGDYGLPRFNATVKNIVNPRCIDYIDDPHVMKYVLGRYRINEQGKIVTTWGNSPVMHDKIILNHYHLKSREEFYLRKSGDSAFWEKISYDVKKHFDDSLKNTNEVFDDSILKYRENRLKNGGGAVGRPINYQRLYSALLQNLSPTFVQNVPPAFYQGKMETFLTCRKLAEYLREKILDKDAGNFFEETALRAIFKTLQTNFSIADIKILFSEMPKILQLNYPVVEEIRKACINFVPQLMNLFRLNLLWRDFNEMYYFGEMLKTFDNYNHK